MRTPAMPAARGATSGWIRSATPSTPTTRSAATRTRRTARRVNVQGQIDKGPISPVTGQFSGAYELEQLLSTTEWVQQCFAVQMTRFALGRDEAVADACSLKAAWDTFASGGQFSIRSLLVAVTGTYAFSHRNNVHAGQACR